MQPDDCLPNVISDIKRLRESA